MEQYQAGKIFFIGVDMEKSTIVPYFEANMEQDYLVQNQVVYHMDVNNAESAIMNAACFISYSMGKQGAFSSDGKDYRIESVMIWDRMVIIIFLPIIEDNGEEVSLKFAHQFYVDCQAGEGTNSMSLLWEQKKVGLKNKSLK